MILVDLGTQEKKRLTTIADANKTPTRKLKKQKNEYSRCKSNSECYEKR